MSKNPIKKVITWGVAGLLLIVFIIALEGIRESSGDNEAVNNAINQVEGQMGISGGEIVTCDCSGWKTAFWILFGVVIFVILIIVGIKIYDEYFDQNPFGNAPYFG